jgi:hypothetical protein
MERPSLEVEQNMQLQIELFNSIMHNKYSGYSKTNNNLTFESPITFTEAPAGHEVSEFKILDDPRYYFDRNSNVHIPGSRYYERYDTDRFFNGMNFQDPDTWWCEGFLSTLRVKLNKEKGLPR